MTLSITPTLIIAAAKKRGWATDIIDETYDLYKLTTPDGEAYYVRNITTFKGSGVNNTLTSHKDLLYKLVEQAGIATLPASETITNDDQARAFLAKHKTVVVKPSNQSHGNGITVAITSNEQMQAALQLARSLSSTVLIQEQIEGSDYRLLFIGGKLAAAAIREPAAVFGDGQHTIRELIVTENQNPQRGTGYEKHKTLIDMESATQYLGAKLEAILPPGQKAQVVGTANIGKGGVAIDVTDTIDAGLVAEAQKLVQHFRIELAGVDYMVQPDGTAYFIEVNIAPSLGLHEYPVQGKARQTPDAFLDWLSAGSKL